MKRLFKQLKGRTIFLFLIGTYVVFICLLITKQKNIEYKINYGYQWEEYDPGLFHRLQSIEDVLNYVDSAVGMGKRGSMEYCEFLASTFRKRFYHGYSHYAPENNWLAHISGKLIWDHLSALVIPDDILKYPNAACSQQSIALARCFKEIGVPYREVDLHGHFVIEGQIDGKWYLFDTNVEPRFSNGRKSLDELIRTNELYTVYKDMYSPERVQNIFAHPIYQQSNARIAPNATLFHKVTKTLSLGSIVLFPLLVLFLVLKGNRKKRLDKSIDYEAVKS